MIHFKISYLFLIIIIFNIISPIINKASNEDITKAMSCLSVLSEKYRNNSPEPSTYFSLLLTCFVTISEVDAKEILLGLEKGMSTIEQEQIDNLTDINILKNYSKEELEEQRKKLNDAVKTFEKLRENYNSGKKDKDREYDNEDEEYKKAHPSRGNALGSFMKKMAKLLKMLNNMGSVVIVLIFAYFGYILLKNCRQNNERKSKEKDKNKNKKNKKKNE